MSWDSRRNLELIATALGVAAVLLPIAGVIVREVAFWSLNVGDYGEIVLGASVGSLAATGFLALLLSIPFVLILVSTYRAAPLLRRLRQLGPRLDRIRRDASAVDVEQNNLKAEIDAVERALEAAELEGAEITESDVSALHERVKLLKARSWEFASRAQDFSTKLDEFEDSEEWKHLKEAYDRSWLAKGSRLADLSRRMPTWIVDAFVLLVTTAVGTLFLSWPSSIPLVLAWITGAFAAPWVARRTDLFQFVGVVVTTAVVVLLVAVAAGLGGIVGSVYVANYTFTPAASLASGRYAHLADSNGFIVLQSCTSQSVVTVDAAEVAHVDQLPPKILPDRPTLWAVAVLGRSPVIGYRSGC